MKKKLLTLFVAFAALVVSFAGARSLVSIYAQSMNVAAVSCSSITSINTFTSPFISSTTACSGSTTNLTCQTPNDGRLDPVCQYQAQTVAVYCNDGTAGGVTLYLVYKGQGIASFTVPEATLQEFDAVSQKTLITKQDGISLYALPGDMLEVDGPADFEGKVFVFRFEACEQ